MKYTGKKIILSLVWITAALFTLESCDNGRDDIQPGNNAVTVTVPYRIVDGTDSLYSVQDLIRSAAGQLGMDLNRLAYLVGLYTADAYPLPSIVRDTTLYRTAVMHYKSVDAAGDSIWLSGRMCYCVDSLGKIVQPDHLMMACRYTSLKEAEETPSMAMGIEMMYPCQGAFTVIPDNIGHGITSYLPEPYCISDLTAQCHVDMLRAAKAFLMDNGFDHINSIPLYCTGYSQAGANALAVTRFIQTRTRGEFDLKCTMCGGGPYSIQATYKDYIEKDWVEYSMALPLILTGMKYAYPDIMTGSESDYFKPAIIEGGILDMIQSREYDAQEICRAIERVLGYETGKRGVKASDVLTEGCIDPNGIWYQQIMEATQRCELTQGWKPNTTVRFYHYPDDEVVPYLNMELARKNLSNSHTTFEDLHIPIAALEAHTQQGYYFYIKAICGAYLR